MLQLLGKIQTSVAALMAFCTLLWGLWGWIRRHGGIGAQPPAWGVRTAGWAAVLCLLALLVTQHLTNRLLADCADKGRYLIEDGTCRYSAPRPDDH